MTKKSVATVQKTAKTQTRESGQHEEPQLSPEQELLVERMQARVNAAVRQMTRRLMEIEPGEIFGPGEFELRDRMNILTAQLVEEVVNSRAKSKKGVPGS